MEKNKLEMIILILLIAFGINYGIYSIYIAPRNEAVKASKTKYNNLNSKLDTLKNMSKQIEGLKKENEANKEKMTVLNTSIPDYIDTPGLTVEFYNSCHKYGVVGESVSFGQPDGKSNVQGIAALPITLKISGNKYNVEDFLKNLNNITKRKLSVVSISIYPQDEKVDFASQVPPMLSLIKSDNIGVEIIFNQYIEYNN